MNREQIFEQYLTTQKQYIDYNGIEYTLIDNENIVIMRTKTPDEMYTYILGFNSLIEDVLELQRQNSELQKQNETNIKSYEKIIKDMGLPSLESKED